MRRCHSRVVCLADGDAAGRGYAKTLAANGIQCVFRWPDEWMIEDVIGWIIEPAHTAVLAALAADIVEPPLTVADLVERLKSDDSKNPKHLKGDRIAYEAIARAISDQPVCLARAAQLLDGLARAAKGEATPRFAKTGTDPTLIFQP
jgi:putative ATP-dependent endonuclease of OLD family